MKKKTEKDKIKDRKEYQKQYQKYYAASGKKSEAAKRYYQKHKYEIWRNSLVDVLPILKDTLK